MNLMGSIETVSLRDYHCLRERERGPVTDPAHIRLDAVLQYS